MRFRNFDELRTFTIVADHSSFSSAADELKLTKGAVSHQVRVLEQKLGFALFFRRARGIELTPKGQELLGTTQSAFEDIERRIAVLKHARMRFLTVGVSPYFAARWLSPRLTTFMQSHPEVQLRIQPMIQFSERELREIDFAIRWGKGGWENGVTTQFVSAPAFPVGDRIAADVVETHGVEHALSRFTLLADRDDSNAWVEWLDVAGLSSLRSGELLVTPDPNVRVQIVINGQGLALMDHFVRDEMEGSKLFRLSEVELTDYGYFLYRPNSVVLTETAKLFKDWLQAQT